MSKVHIISYDLKKEGHDYSGLYEKIKQCGEWRHYLDSTWLVSSSKSAQQIYNLVKGSLDANDHILIAEITNDYYGYLNKTAWDWIRQKLSE